MQKGRAEGDGPAAQQPARSERNRREPPCKATAKAYSLTLDWHEQHRQRQTLLGTLPRPKASMRIASGRHAVPAQGDATHLSLIHI